MAELRGRVIDLNGNPIPSVTITYEEKGVSSDENGIYSIIIPSDKKVEVVFSHVAFYKKYLTLRLAPGEVKVENVRLQLQNTSVEAVEVYSERYAGTSKISIDPENARFISTPGDAVIGLIKSAGMGVSSNNELSTGYSVRGGNFDENLIYVNDIEIYRPFLARAGQQEGLSFINSDMVRDITFSSGGFEAKYGDKMSSVLDINYKKPSAFIGVASAGILGGNLTLGDALLGNRFTYILGGRYRSNNYILRGLDTRGEYQPIFADVQGFFTFAVTENFEINLLTTYSKNQFNVIPQDRTTDFGSVAQALRLRVFFAGQEVTEFETGTAALSAVFKKGNATHKLIASGYFTDERETFDVIGAYFLGELDRNLGSETFGDVISELGVGAFMNHARNRLQANVLSFQEKSAIIKEKQAFHWGFQYNLEDIFDRLSEWNLLDSSGFMLPYNGPADNNPIELMDVRRNTFSLITQRLSAYYQNTFSHNLKDSSSITWNLGVRAQYWTGNEQVLISPRGGIAWKPKWERSMIFRLASGVYYQAPFYRELRNLNGDLFPGVRAQRSIHFILGTDYYFKIWDRPFKFSSEAYYKHLDDLNPYKLDNVRIRYYAQNNAVGYATGIDFKLNGEFVKGIESWINLSFMKTQEDILDDFFYQFLDANGNVLPIGANPLLIADSVRIEPGFIPRPTDQRFNFSIFFQDYIRNNPNFKVHLNFLFGTRLPFGPPTDDRFRDTLRMPPYRRVDIGFSFQLLKKDRLIERENIINKTVKELWATLEVFNLLGINNTINHTWIRDITRRQFAVPNYLTPRLLNARVIVSF